MHFESILRWTALHRAVFGGIVSASFVNPVTCVSHSAL